MEYKEAYKSLLGGVNSSEIRVDNLWTGYEPRVATTTRGITDPFSVCYPMHVYVARGARDLGIEDLLFFSFITVEPRAEQYNNL